MLIQNRITTTSRSKKVVLKLRSVNNIVIAPANTGKDSNNKKAVIKILQTNKGMLNNPIPGVLILNNSSNKIYCT